MSAEPNDEGTSPSALDEPDGESRPYRGPARAAAGVPPARRRLRDVFGGAAVGAALAAGAWWGLAAPPSEPADPRSAEGGAMAPHVLHGGGPATGASAPAVPGSGTARSGVDGGETELVQQVEQARQLMDRGAWLGPLPESVEVVVADLSTRSPEHPRVRRLRREAAERLLAHAVASSYAGRSATARRQIQLALRWAPALPGARPLLKDLKDEPDDLSDGLELAPQPTRRGPDGIEPGGAPTSLAPDRLPDHADR